MRKRVWLKVGEWVLVSLRDFQDNKCNIIHKYSESDVNQLKKIGAITGNIETELTMVDTASELAGGPHSWKLPL